MPSLSFKMQHQHTCFSGSYLVLTVEANVEMFLSHTIHTKLATEEYRINSKFNFTVYFSYNTTFSSILLLLLQALLP